MHRMKGAQSNAHHLIPAFVLMGRAESSPLLFAGVQADFCVHKDHPGTSTLGVKLLGYFMTAMLRSLPSPAVTPDAHILP